MGLVEEQTLVARGRGHDVHRNGHRDKGGVPSVEAANRAELTAHTRTESTRRSGLGESESESESESERESERESDLRVNLI